MKAEAELAKRELARRRLLNFVTYNFEGYDINWHHRVIAEKLEAVERGDIKRLMIFMPPRAGKSEICAIQFPAWYLGRHPDRDIITASYSSDLAVDFGRRVRNIVNTESYSRLFKTKLSEDNQSAGKWTTKERGEYLAAGVGGGITGRGADVLILDDVVKNREEAESETIRKRNIDWFKSTAYTRLSPQGAIILIMTRWHDNDLAGALLSESNSQWEVVSFPAIAERDEEYRKQGEALWKSRFSLEKLEEIKRTIGTYEFSSLYQQSPLDTESQEFKRNQFMYRTMEEVLALRTRKYLTIDTAISKSSGSDFTGIVSNFVDQENKWNLKAYRMKLTPLELIDLLFTMQDNDHYDKIGIEETIYLDAIKPFLDQEMRTRNRFLPIVPLKHNRVAKELRVRSLLPRYESHSIYHIQGETSELEEELLRFPKGIHDDVADAAAYQTQIAMPAPKRTIHSIPYQRSRYSTATSAY